MSVKQRKECVNPKTRMKVKKFEMCVCVCLPKEAKTG